MSTEPSADPARAGEALLQARGIAVSFGGVKALRGVDLTVHGGQVLGVIGPNGAGKTTLFDAISGDVRTTQGDIRFRGVDIASRPTAWRARNGIRRTFQRQQLVHGLSVLDNVALGQECGGGGGGLVADLLGLPRRRRLEQERREAARAALEVCQLGDWVDKPAAGLSIGHARLVELARAVVDAPALLLLDEPTSGMSDAEGEVVAEAIERLRVDPERAVVIIEHDVPFVMRMCDRVLALNLGTVLSYGTPDEVRNDPRVQQAYFGDMKQAEQAATAVEA